jgi:hypothetical protein
MRGDENFNKIDRNLIFKNLYSLYSNNYDEAFPSAFLFASPTNYVTNNIVSGSTNDAYVFSLNAYIYEISSWDMCPSHEQ